MAVPLARDVIHSSAYYAIRDAAYIPAPSVSLCLVISFSFTPISVKVYLYCEPVIYALFACAGWKKWLFSRGNHHLSDVQAFFLAGHVLAPEVSGIFGAVVIWNPSQSYILDLSLWVEFYFSLSLSLAPSVSRVYPVDELLLLEAFFRGGRG